MLIFFKTWNPNPITDRCGALRGYRYKSATHDAQGQKLDKTFQAQKKKHQAEKYLSVKTIMSDMDCVGTDKKYCHKEGTHTKPGLPWSKKNVTIMNFISCTLLDGFVSACDSSILWWVSLKYFYSSASG